VFVAEPLLPGEDFEGFNVAVLAIQLVCPSPAVPKSYYVGVHPVISQPLQSLVKGAVHHVSFGQKGQVFFIVDGGSVSSFDRQHCYVLQDSLSHVRTSGTTVHM
jgi:hypothetical protein